MLTFLTSIQIISLKSNSLIEDASEFLMFVILPEVKKCLIPRYLNGKQSNKICYWLTH